MSIILKQLFSPVLILFLFFFSVVASFTIGTGIVSAEHSQCRVQSGDDFFWVDAPSPTDPTSCGTVPGFTGEVRDGPHNDDGSPGDPVIPDPTDPTDPDPTDPVDPGDGEGEGQIAEESCESEGGEFSFLACPLLKLANDGIDRLDNEIRDALEVSPEYYEDESVRNAWGRIRNIAAILLIPIMLVLVIGTALGVSAVDAYTVKRAMPRLFIAVIFMVLSYDIAIIMIDVTNAIGRGVGGLLVGAFTGGNPNELTLSNIFNPGGFADTAVGVGILGGIALVGIGALSISILVSYMFTAFIALVIIFSILTIRELVILFLVVLSPLAILSWIFPGNDKLWKIWWDTFTKLLLVYPVIFALLVMGRIFAWLIGSVPSEGIEGIFIVMAKLAAYIGPFFFLLVVLKVLTGAFGTLTGMVNDRSKGAFDRARNFRAEKRKELGQAAKEGRRFNKVPFVGGSRVMRKASRGVAYGTNARSSIENLGANPRNWKRRMGENMRTALGDQAHDLSSEFMEKDAAFQAIGGDDAKLWAAKFNDRKKIEEELAAFDNGRFGGPENARQREEAVQQILRAKQGASDEVFQKARVRAQAKTGTGYINQDTGEVEIDRMLEDINHAYGSDRNGAGRALAEMRSSLANSGQTAGLAGFGTWAQQLERVHNAASLPEAERGDVLASAHDAIMRDAADSLTPGQAMFGKPSSARAVATVHRRRIEGIAQDLQSSRGLRARAEASGNTEQVAQADRMIEHYEGSLDAATAAAAGLLDAMNHSASPQNASAFANELMGVTITGQQTLVSPAVEARGPNPARPAEYRDATVRDMIDDRMNNEEYRNRRRDIGSRTISDAEAARAAAATPGAGVGGGLGGGLGGGVPGV